MIVSLIKLYIFNASEGIKDTNQILILDLKVINSVISMKHLIPLITYQCFQILWTPRCFLSGSMWHGYLLKKLCLIWAEYFNSQMSVYAYKL